MHQTEHCLCLSPEVSDLVLRQFVIAFKTILICIKEGKTLIGQHLWFIQLPMTIYTILKCCKGTNIATLNLRYRCEPLGFFFFFNIQLKKWNCSCNSSIQTAPSVKNYAHSIIRISLEELEVWIIQILSAVGTFRWRGLKCRLMRLILCIKNHAAA